MNPAVPGAAMAMSAPGEALKVTAATTTPAAQPSRRATTAWFDALISGSFELLSAEPGGSGADASAADADVTGSAPPGPPAGPVPQVPPPALARERPAEAIEASGTVPADPALLVAVERLDARISELKAADADEAAPVPVTKPASFPAGASDARIVGGMGVNVRSGPSSSSAKLFALPGGQKVTVTGNKRGWLRVVDQRGRSGWAYSSYLRSPKS